MKDKIELIQEYYKKVKASNKEFTKKEAFKDLLNRLYSNDNEIQSIIDKITLGAEKTVVNIPRKDRLHKGSADTLYNNIIIEFENNLKVTYNHAKEQLAGYLLGQFNSGEGYNFTLIVSDFINWKIVAPDIEYLDKLDTVLEHELVLNEIESASFTLTETNCEEFYYWIDRFLFKEEKQKATLKRIEESFGYQSPVFIESYRELSKWFDEAKKYGIVQVSYEQWHKFLSIAYGSFEARESVFLIHTYLSIFSKMLAYSVISNDDYIDDDEMRKVLNGSIFNSYNISNFVDNDFFHWVNGDKDYHNLKKVFRLIAQEISAYDFTNVNEDILKGVYQELIDLDTRHSLGEYYTPDWLCERIVNEFEFSNTDKILDPSCGSGSFLRAIIHRIKELNPNSSAEEINNQVYGIDIHPLSVQIAKTTLLLTLGNDITKSKKPVHLNIILANTLLAPEGDKSLFGNEYMLTIDKEKYLINTQVFENVEMFDSVLDVCEEIADQTINKKSITIKNFENIVHVQTKKGGFNEQLIKSFYEIYKGFKDVKEKGRDSIWKFIVSNLYKPYFLKNKFDYIIGNPPWFTYSSVKNEEYQYILDKLANKYQIKPERVANYPHLEIAAIFQSYCPSYFLKEEGKQALVLPRSFFSADHHNNTRSGLAKGFRITNIWDLNDVNPLFRIPSCVLFSEKAHVKRKIKTSGLNGKKFSGRLPYHNCHYDIASNKLIETNVTWYIASQGNTTAFSNRKSKKQKNFNPYKSKFKQGATIVPRAFYFVDINQEYPEDFDDRIINIKTANSIKADAKAPWNDIDLSGQINSQFLFRTAISRSILPFNLYKPDLVVLPIVINNINSEGKRIKLKSAKELMNLGHLGSSRWFSNCENIWDINKTEKNKDITAVNYLNWVNKLIDQDLNAKYIVLYNGRGANACSCVVDREKLDLEFIVDHAIYYIPFANIDEAYYIASILNSDAPNDLMKEFQSTGLFGARNIHKKILDIYFPQYDSTDELHNNLAELGKTCELKVQSYFEDNPQDEDLTARKLGRLRVEIKDYLNKEMKSIDKIVKKLLK